MRIRYGMKEAEFDRFAEEYRAIHAGNIRASGDSPEFFAEYKVLDIARRLKHARCVAHTILDFGAGVGNSVPHFTRYFPNAALTCADVSAKSLEIAQSRFSGLAEFRKIDESGLGEFRQRFDVIFSACVFHHIPHERHVGWLSRLLKVARPEALLAVFEHNPWNPLTVRAVNNCPFDINARLIDARKMRRAVAAAGWRNVESQYRIFFPGQLAALRGLERAMTWLPLGAQYVVYATR